ncbi:MAG: serpin family protein [Planctomycetes bacterium]|nr:serpin family protein [Planctomycetota bacterium]
MNPLHSLLSRLVLLAAVSLSVAPLAVRLTAQQPARETPEQQLVAALNRFAADLHGRLGAPPGDSALSSPASVAITLLMLLPGARGETADEIAAVLHLPPDLRGERLATAAQTLLAHTLVVSAENGAALRIANDLWGQAGREFGADWLKQLRDAFGGDAHEVDFAKDPDGARRRINERIAAATNRRIVDLVPPGVITPATRTVLSNAIWYRGSWLQEFHRADRPGAFHVTPARAVEAAMLWATSRYRYCETDAWQAVELPFDDDAIVFEIVLPRPGHDLAVAERALLEGKHRESLAAVDVRVGMPAFTIAGRHRLRDALTELGLRAAFDQARADFSGITRYEPLVLEDVIHGTFLRVDEHGVEAAAATVLVIEGRAAIRQPKVLQADRPFAFALRDRRTGLVLFAGRLIDPTIGA